MPRTLIVALASWVALGAQTPVRPSASAFLAHVRVLADDGLGGRGNGTEGLERAADYIAGQFAGAGLAPIGAGGFDQPFHADVRVEPPASAALHVRTEAGVRTLALGRDFYPVSVLDRAPGAPPPTLVDIPLVFAGYGLSAPGLGYDEFDGIEVRDAAVLVLTHEPQEHDRRSRFDGTQLTPGAAIAVKAREVRERGGRLLVVVEDPSHASDRAVRGAWWADPQSENLGIPVVRVARQSLAVALPGLDLTAEAARIDRTLTPRSRPLPGVSITYTEHRAQFRASLRNIVGVVRGADPALAGEAVVVGAHYDHLGTGGAFSEAPEATGVVHNGADDNASGTAALIEIARAVAARNERLPRTVVFAAFAGEELGLQGSTFYTTQPVVPLAHTVAMVNLDMVGRARGRVLVGVFGARGHQASNTIDRLRPWTRLQVTDFSRGGGYPVAASDVAPFARHGVMAVAFFTGFHADYHRPSDDWRRVDAEGGADIARLALRLVEHVARQ